MLPALAMLTTGCERAAPSPAVRVEDRLGRSASSILADAEGDEETDHAGAIGIVGLEAFDGDGDRKVWVRRIEGAAFTELVVAEKVDEIWESEVRIVGRANPDRPAIDPDGNVVAFVSGISGLALIYVVPFDGTDDPTQLTNLGLGGMRRSPGLPPDGWVPPPIDDSLHFDGNFLDWNGPDGPLTVQWRF